MPPLVITPAEVDEVLAALAGAMREALRKKGLGKDD